MLNEVQLDSDAQAAARHAAVSQVRVDRLGC